MSLEWLKKAYIILEEYHFQEDNLYLKFKS